MNPSTSLCSSNFDHLPPPPTLNHNDTVWQTFDSPTLANQVHAIFLPRMEDILNDEVLLELFRSAERLLKKQPGHAKITPRFYSTLRDHVHFRKPANENRVFFGEPTGRYSVVHPASVVVFISAHTQPRHLPRTITASYPATRKDLAEFRMPIRARRAPHPAKQLLQRMHHMSSRTNLSRPPTFHFHIPSPNVTRRPRYSIGALFRLLRLYHRSHHLRARARLRRRPLS
ncbi:hypothetical protein BC938DRAFT_473057 [Jimgerdemannia flammicorona]|uniref:Uncharacterized protein n=1 Tax=Jimgerdemannia flammicorona TaxID=994334 RepID=A0A433Q4S8_9FUNG|nr:hypothetical protein BC938DRAFT_473057 [Jimgerdemannia flammicorona]